MPAKQAAAAAATLIALLLLGYLIWQPAGEERDGDAASSPASPHTFTSAQRQNFAVLRGRTQPVPRSLQAELRQARNHTVRTLWLDTARHLRVGDGVWVANGRDSTCVIQAHGGAVACVPTDMFFRTGVALGVAELGPQADRKAPEFMVYGIVPNQIKAIVVRIGRERRTVAIRDNSYWLRAAEPILVKRFKR